MLGAENAKLIRGDIVRQTGRKPDDVLILVDPIAESAFRARGQLNYLVVDKTTMEPIFNEDGSMMRYVPDLTSQRTATAEERAALAIERRQDPVYQRMLELQAQGFDESQAAMMAQEEAEARAGVRP